MYSKPDSLALVGAHWMNVGTPTRSMARTIPIVVSMLVVLNAPATRWRDVHAAMTSCPLTRGIALSFRGHPSGGRCVGEVVPTVLSRRPRRAILGSRGVG